MSWIHGAVARLRLLARRSAESRMDEESRLHIEMETDRLVREEQLAPDEARRRALVAFGGVQGHREDLRAGRGLAWLGGLTLDLRLGLRMLRKYPGLTVVAVCGIAMAVAIASVMFTMVSVLANPALPFPEGERIVGIRIWDRRANDRAPSTVHDLVAWRQQLTSIAEVGAFRTVRRNVMLPGAFPEPMALAEMTASAFHITRVAPLLGRYFVEDDERAGAPPVVMLGYELWRSRFDGDPSVIGRILRLGRTDHTIVGIMPRGYGFPVSHQMWIPLRADPFTLPRGAGHDILVHSCRSRSPAGGARSGSVRR